ncbi:MAG: methyltransferase domain-containing protein [Candidatus Hydrogenedentes bacterium]|nr:methyltransferase domain-containing protein [Candidatus Hydrogenedentota bacterium]
MQRIPEAEIMDIPERAQAYADADFREVNEAFVERLLELAGDLASARVLDLGTGPGEMPFRIAAQRPGWRIVGLDASMPMLRLGEAARREGSTAMAHRFVLADAKRTPFADDTFDVIFSNSILHHVDDPVAFWKEAARVAKPGALLFVRDLLRPESPEAAHDLVETYAADEHPLLKEDFYNSLLAAYTPNEIRSQLLEASITPLDITPVTDRHVDVSGRFC